MRMAEPHENETQATFDPIAEEKSRAAAAALARLVERARAGEDDAGTELIGTYQKRIAGYLFRMTCDPNVVDDLCQTVFVKMIRALPGLRDVSRFEPWLFRIARNAGCSHWRRERLRRIFTPLLPVHENLPAADPNPLSCELAEVNAALQDLPPRHRDFGGLRVIAENCRKHIRVLCFTPAGMDALVAMKPVFPGNWFSVGFTAHGPLRWTNLSLEIFRRSAGHGIPATINGEPMAGVSGPVTIAGAAAVGNAEILAGIVVNQLLEPGRPVIYNLGLAHVFDMKTATAVTGGPENALFADISAAMGRFYNIPSSSWVSTESCFTDQQAGMEKMFGFHTHSNSGVSLIWGMGQLESELTMSLGQLVVDNEMINYARRYQRGCAVNEETLAYDLIREVGISGSFLETDHTLLNFWEQLFTPSLLNRKVREASSETLDIVASQRAREIITADTEAKITPAESAELRRVEQLFRSRIA